MTRSAKVALISVLTITGLIVALTLAAAIDDALNGRSVEIANTGNAPIRLSGCQIDGALDLQPGQSQSQDFIGRTGCSAYDMNTYHFAGCLIIAEGKTSPKHYNLPRALSRTINQSECDQIQ